MAKLVDALCSGRSARKGVLVRIQFWALKAPQLMWGFVICTAQVVVLVLNRAENGAASLLRIRFKKPRLWPTPIVCRKRNIN
jgi:hypothetical protein